MTTLAMGLVTFTLLTEEAKALLSITGTGLYTAQNDDTEIIVSTTGGWAGHEQRKWEAPTIYIDQWNYSGDSAGGYVYAKGNLSDITNYSGYNPETYTGHGNITFKGNPGSVLRHDLIFDGNHANFSGDFILSVTAYNGNVNGRDFVFTNSQDYGDTVQTNVTGTGAIEMATRTGVEGLDDNLHDGSAHFFYSGNVTIGNSKITAYTLSLNSKEVADASASDSYKTNRAATTGTGGASYTISSVLTLTTLEVNDGSTAILTRGGSSVDSVSIASGSSLQIADGGSLTVNTAITANSNVSVASGGLLTVNGTMTAGNSLSIVAGGQLTMGGTLILTDAITNTGTLSFTNSAILNLGDLTGTTNGDSISYQITTGGTVDITALTWESIRGVAGTVATTTLSYENGILTLDGIQNDLDFTGGATTAETRTLSWNDAGAFDGNSSYNAGQTVNFTGYTSATLTESISMGNLNIATDSALSLNAGAGITFKAIGVTMDTNTQFSIAVATLNTDAGPLKVTGNHGSTLRLDGHDGAAYNFADMLSLADYTGEISVNNATVTIASMADVGSMEILTLGDGAILNISGITFDERLHIGGGNATVNGSPTVTSSATPPTDATFLTEVTGVGTLTLNNQVAITSNMAFTGAIVVNSGTMWFGANENDSNTLAASSIRVKLGAQFRIAHASHDFATTDIILEGGTLYSGDINNNSLGGLSFKDLNVIGGGTVSHRYNGVFTFDNLTGDGTLTFNCTGESGELRFNAVTDYSGTINFNQSDDNDKLLLRGAISQAADHTLTLTGRRADAEGATFSGAGAVNFSSGVRLTGTNTLSSGTLSLTSIEFGNNESNLTATGGQLNLNGASFNASTDGTLKLGATTITSSEASVTIAEKMELGAVSTGSAVGTVESPVLTTLSTTQNDGGGNVALSITSSIFDIAGSVGGLKVTGAGSLDLNAANSFSGGLEIEGASVTLGTATSAGSGAITVSSGSLSVGGHAISNDVHFTSGTITGMSAFSGTLQVDGDLTLTDGISGTINVSAGGSLTLGGTWTYDSAIQNEGTVTLNADTLIDITGLVFTDKGDGTFGLVLVSGGALEDSAWLNAGTLNPEKLIGTVAGRTYSYSNGELLYTLSARLLTWNGGKLNLNGDTEFHTGGSYEAGALITFGAGESEIEVLADVSASSVTVSTGATVTTTGTAHTFTIEDLILNTGSSFTTNESVDVARILLNTDSSMTIDSLEGTTSVLLEGTAAITVTGALAAGANTLDIIEGGSSSQLTLALAGEGSTVSAANFTGHLTVSSGKMESALTDINDFASVTLGAGASYEITTELPNAISTLTFLRGDADSTLYIDAIGVAVGDGPKSSITLASGFNGTVELTNGTLGTLYTSLGGASRLVMHNNTALVGDALAYQTSTFAKDVEIASGTAYARVWGTERVLDITGALIGSSDTTFAKVDGGTVKLSGDMTNFSGNLSVQVFKMVLDTNAASINTISLSTGTTFEVAAGHHVATIGADDGLGYYIRRTNYDYNIVVGTGATLTDNVHMQLFGGTVNISGNGTYTIDGYQGSDGGGSTLVIAAGTKLHVTGTTTSAEVGLDDPAFAIAHYGGAGAVTVAGTLELESGISNQDSAGTITVQDEGVLILNQGLYGEMKNQYITIIAQEGSLVQLGNQTTASDKTIGDNADDNIITNFAAGSTIEAIIADSDVSNTDKVVNILNTMALSGTNANVTLTAASDVKTVNVQNVISNVEGNNAGLTIDGTGTQNFNLNAANTYEGGTVIAGGIATAGHASAFSTGEVSVDAGAQMAIAEGIAVSNNIELANTAVLNAGVLSATGRDTGTSAITGVGKTIEHTASNVSSIQNATITDMNMMLDTDSTAHINDSVLSGTNIQLGGGSTMNMRGTVQGLGSTIQNADASLVLTDHTMQVATGSNLTIKNAEVQTEGDKHDMIVYSLTSINVADVTMEGSLELDIVLSTAEYAAFAEQYVTNKGFVAFELQNITQADLAAIWYHTVEINIYLENLEPGSVQETLNPLGVSSLDGNALFYVPEPSTATLSLLALAGLLARRRRKDA